MRKWLILISTMIVSFNAMGIELVINIRQAGILFEGTDYLQSEYSLINFINKKCMADREIFKQNECKFEFTKEAMEKYRSAFEFFCEQGEDNYCNIRFPTIPIKETSTLYVNYICNYAVEEYEQIRLETRRKLNTQNNIVRSGFANYGDTIKNLTDSKNINCKL